MIMPPSITEQYDEIDRLYTEALFAIRGSQRSPEARMALLKQLQDGHGNATNAADQRKAIIQVMKELEGND